MTYEDYMNARMEGRVYVAGTIESPGPVGEGVRFKTIVMDGIEEATLGECHGPPTLHVTD